MKRLTTAVAALTLLLSLAACKSHKGLGYLEAYIGQLPKMSGMWDSQPLHSQLKDLTGDQFDQFIKYMDKAGPLVQKDSLLYTIAPIEHDTTKGYAYILIDKKSSNIQAAMETNVSIQKFQSPREAFTLPREIQDKLDAAFGAAPALPSTK